MRFENTLSAFQNNLSHMTSAQARIQNGFARALDKQNSPTQDENSDFTSAFVEEDFAANLAKAQLKVLESQDDILETVLQIKDDTKV